MEGFIISAGAAALGVWGIRMLRQLDSLHDKADDQGQRLANIEGRLSNGIQAELNRVGQVDTDVRELRHAFETFRTGEFREMKESMDDHVENEEQRIVDIYRRLVEGGGR